VVRYVILSVILCGRDFEIRHSYVVKKRVAVKMMIEGIFTGAG
jgi:hypothetical protein